VAKLGHQVTIATYHIGEDPDFGDVSNQIIIKRIHRLLFWYHKKTAGPSWQKILLDILLINKIFWLVLKNDYDVIHAHLHEGVAISFVVTRLLFWKNIKILGDFHGDMVGEMVSHGYLNIFFIKTLFKWAERLIYGFPDRIITSSQGLADTIVQLVPDHVIGCIPDGGNSGVNTSLQKVLKLKDDLGIPHDANLVVYTGGFTNDKGVTHLLRALEHPHVQVLDNLYICLAGFPYEKIALQVINHSMTHKIVVLDQFKSSRLDDLFALAMVVVDPKDEQGFQASGKMIRYIMAGLPIVCFNTGVNRSYLGNEYPFASLTDQGSFAQKIIQMVGDPLFYKQAIDWVKSRQKLFLSDTLARAVEYEYIQLCIK